MLKGMTKHQQLNYKRTMKRQRERELAADAAQGQQVEIPETAAKAYVPVSSPILPPQGVSADLPLTLSPLVPHPSVVGIFGGPAAPPQVSGAPSPRMPNGMWAEYMRAVGKPLEEGRESVDLDDVFEAPYEPSLLTLPIPHVPTQPFVDIHPVDGYRERKMREKGNPQVPPPAVVNMSSGKLPAIEDFDQPQNVIEAQLMVQSQAELMVVQRNTLRNTLDGQLRYAEACVQMSQKMEDLAREYAACNLQAKQLMDPTAALPSSTVLPRVTSSLRQPLRPFSMSAMPSAFLPRDVMRSFDPWETASMGDSGMTPALLRIRQDVLRRMSAPKTLLRLASRTENRLRDRRRPSISARGRRRSASSIKRNSSSDL